MLFSPICLFLCSPVRIDRKCFSLHNHSDQEGLNIMFNPSCSDFGDGIWMWYLLHIGIEDASRHYTDCRNRVICGTNPARVNRSCVSVLLTIYVTSR